MLRDIEISMLEISMAISKALLMWWLTIRWVVVTQTIQIFNIWLIILMVSSQLSKLRTYQQVWVKVLHFHRFTVPVRMETQQMLSTYCNQDLQLRLDGSFPRDISILHNYSSQGSLLIISMSRIPPYLVFRSIQPLEIKSISTHRPVVRGTACSRRECWWNTGIVHCQGIHWYHDKWPAKYWPLQQLLSLLCFISVLMGPPRRYWTRYH